MTKKVTMAIPQNTSHKFDLSSLLIVIDNSNILPKFDYAVFI